MSLPGRRVVTLPAADAAGYTAKLRRLPDEDVAAQHQELQADAERLAVLLAGALERKDIAAAELERRATHAGQRQGSLLDSGTS